jgi:hypothetical protein
MTMVPSRLLLVGAVLVAAVVVQVVLSDSAADKLIRDKKDSYLSITDPGNFTLKLGVGYVCGNYNHRTHLLTSRVFERYTWKDARLAWNPKDYSGLAKVSIPADKVWTPDVKLFNSFYKSEDRDEHTNVVVMADGTVVWVPPATYTTLCEEEDHEDDHTYKCKLQLAPWTRDAVDMPLELFEGGFDTKLYLKNCPYIVKESSVHIKSNKYDCCPNPFLHLHIDLELEHREDEEEEEEEEKEKKSRRELHHKEKACFWPHC